MKRVLAVDGGGIFGILPARLLADIEARTGRPAAQLFDLIAGNSTGGIIAAGLAAGVPASRLVSLYVDKGAAIFARGILQDVETGDGALQPRYQAAALEGELQAILGDAYLSAVEPAQLLVPTSVVQGPAGPDAFFFKSWKARGLDLGGDETADDFDFPLWQVARSTSAAPTYFPTACATSRSGKEYWCVDGGLYCNAPSVAALTAANELWPGEDVHLLSLGTGANKPAPLDGAATRSWGAVEWLPHILQIMMSFGASAADREASTALGPRYLRCDIGMEGAPGLDTAFDDASAVNIAAISALAGRLVAQSGAAAAAFVAR